MFYSFDDIGVIERGNILEYVSICDTYKVKKGYVVDIYTKNSLKPLCSTFIRLKSLKGNIFWEINSLKHMYLSNKKPQKRRSDFKIMINNYLKK